MTPDEARQAHIWRRAVAEEGRLPAVEDVLVLDRDGHLDVARDPRWAAMLELAAALQADQAA